VGSIKKTTEGETETGIRRKCSGSWRKGNGSRLECPLTPTTFDTILDHDTNVFYAYSNAELYSLDMDSLKASQEEPIPWADVQKPDLSVYDTNQATQMPGKNTWGV